MRFSGSSSVGRATDAYEVAGSNPAFPIIERRYCMGIFEMQVIPKFADGDRMDGSKIFIEYCGGTEKVGVSNDCNKTRKTENEAAVWHRKEIC